jgi:citrate lyase subunit beta / citryl-CoA lyase
MRSLLFTPADSERKIARSLASAADIVILDLEDSIAPGAKAAARGLLRDVLAGTRDRTLYVRVNDLASGLIADDLKALEARPPDGIMLPKCASGRDIRKLAERTALPVIAICTETAGSLFEMSTYRDAGPTLRGLAWGLEDLSADLGAETARDADGEPTAPYRLARSLCLIAARAAGVDPIDGVEADFRDLKRLERAAREAARDGFSAKMCIHPDQVAIINAAFTPSAEAVSRARRIVAAFEAAGGGVASLDGAMIDMPHLKQARLILNRAQAT